MDRALKIEALRDALGDHASSRASEAGRNEQPRHLGSGGSPTSLLPTPEELQNLLARTEVQLFLNQRDLPEGGLLRTAWFLHGVASADGAYELYTNERQRRAFGLSAHIFDLATLVHALDSTERLRLTFAAQVGYHRSEGEPNAIAMARRVAPYLNAESPLVDHLPTLPLEAGIALLSTDVAAYRQTFRTWDDQLQALAADIEVDSLTHTMFGPTACVVKGAISLIRFLTRGYRNQLDRARELFELAIRVEEGNGDHDARWVAAHLRFLTDEMDAGSVWSLLPPSVPASAKQAFTLTAPSVLTLWRPQRQLLGARVTDSEISEAATPQNALDPAVRRIVLSVPTSAGKTLLAQLMMVAHLATAGTGVCYVAPQHSLGREVRQGLTHRLRVLAREIGNDGPDFELPYSTSVAELIAALSLDPASMGSMFSAVEDSEPDVVVMTPERLANALRVDPNGVLSRYGLFVFDEAHLLGETSRGFLLESVITFLHWRTRDTHHRIALLSAALGNAGQLASWLRVDEDPILLESPWRGPRRLHAVFTTSINWDKGPEVTNVAARGAKAHLTQRWTYDTDGVLRLRLAEGKIVSWKTPERVGVTCFRATASGKRERSPEDGQGTAFYKMLVTIVRHVGHAGPVLVIESTRKA